MSNGLYISEEQQRRIIDKYPIGAIVRVVDNYGVGRRPLRVKKHYHCEKLRQGILYAETLQGTCFDISIRDIVAVLYNPNKCFLPV